MPDEPSTRARRDQCVLALGAAYGAAGLLRSVAVHSRQERCLLPMDVLAEYGMTCEQVIAKRDAAAVQAVVKRLAKEGMRFDNCFATNSICAPSRATVTYCWPWTR